MGIENVRLGPCNLTFGGTNLGLTVGGVIIAINATVDSRPYFTNMPPSALPYASNISVAVQCSLAESTIASFCAANPWSTLSTVGQAQTATITDIAQSDLRSYAKELIINPIDTSELITIPLALPRPAMSLTYSYNETRAIKIDFVALPSGTNKALIHYTNSSTS